MLSGDKKDTESDPTEEEDEEEKVSSIFLTPLKQVFLKALMELPKDLHNFGYILKRFHFPPSNPEHIDSTSVALVKVNYFAVCLASCKLREP